MGNQNLIETRSWWRRPGGLILFFFLVCQMDQLLLASGNTSRVVIQGQTIIATQVVTSKMKVEEQSIEVTKLICELARAYPAATAMNVKVSLDVTGAEEKYGPSEDGPVEIDQIKIDNLPQIRKCSGYHELLYGDFFWLPSRLQRDLDILKKRADSSR